jgi:hypothetical protein
MAGCLRHAAANSQACVLSFKPSGLQVRRRGAMKTEQSRWQSEEDRAILLALSLSPAEHLILSVLLIHVVSLSQSNSRAICGNTAVLELLFLSSPLPIRLPVRILQ